MKYKADYTLYLVTDREIMSTKTLEEAVEQAIRGGCTMVQLREKKLGSGDFYKTAVNIKRVTERHQIPLVINDRVDIALAAGADGVHVGQSDLPAKTARALIGDRILGVSVSNAREAVRAARDGADYIGVGAMYATDTKTDATPVSAEELKRIREAVTIPIVVIGGINQRTAANFYGSGADGLAAVSGVIAQKDIEKAARKLVRLFLRGPGADERSL